MRRHEQAVSDFVFFDDRKPVEIRSLKTSQSIDAVEGERRDAEDRPIARWWDGRISDAGKGATMIYGVDTRSRTDSGEDELLPMRVRVADEMIEDVHVR